MITHKHWLPPTLVYIRGEQYLVPAWKKVPNNTKLSDIKWEKEKILPAIKKEPKIIVETFVSSSDPSIL